MTYEDAQAFLHIAENSYDAGSYIESAEITRKLAYYAVDRHNGLTANQREEFTEAVKRLISRFTYCHDEAIWEETSQLMDLFE